METFGIEVCYLHPDSHTLELGKRLQELNSDWEVGYTYRDRGASGPPDAAEIVTIWLPKAWEMIKEPLLSAMIPLFVEWARRRLQQLSQKKDESEILPQVVELYGPDGNILKRIKVSSPGGEVEDLTDETGFLSKLNRPIFRKNLPK